jgi:hypothetical protein
MSREVRAWAALGDRAEALLLPDVAARVHAAVRRRQVQARNCRWMAAFALLLTLAVNGVLLFMERSSPAGAERERAFLAERYELLRSL